MALLLRRPLVSRQVRASLYQVSQAAMTTTSNFVIPPPPIPSVPVVGESQVFPVHRIYCVGRNYADHAVEMGGDPSREPPFFFTKPADAIVPTTNSVSQTNPNNDTRTSTTIPYPLATQNLHHEIELVVAIGKAGTQISQQYAMEHVYGYAVGVDLTRRDLQSAAKQTSRPWDSAKAFDQSAPISAIVPKEKTTMNHQEDPESSSSRTNRIWLTVNGQLQQDGSLDQMTWKVPEIIAILSQQFHLQPGDLIYTGTPSGVGPLQKGDVVQGGVDALEDVRVEFTIT